MKTLHDFLKLATGLLLVMLPVVACIENMPSESEQLALLISSEFRD